MALHTYTIYSAATASDEDSLISVTEPVVDDEQDRSVGERISHQAPMNFVREQGEYDVLGRLVSGGISYSSAPKKESSGVGDWYSSIQRSATKSAPPSGQAAPSSTPPDSRGVLQTDIVAPVPQAASSTSSSARKPDWFKSTAIAAGLERSNQPTLADMIRRDPPNPRKPHVPPVHYALGPDNRGYDMLSRGGWQEGQPLGPLGQHDPKRSLQAHPSTSSTKSASNTEEKVKFRVLSGTMPKLAVPREGSVGVNLVDLTRPDEEDSEESDDDDLEDNEDILISDSSNIRSAYAPADNLSEERQEEEDIENYVSTSKGGPILTPIPIVLKHNRKGIGMSKKRRLVTHSSLALLHHEQQGENARRHHKSELRRLEKDHRQGKYGTGKRAFARMAKEEEAKRQRLLEYMKS